MVAGLSAMSSVAVAQVPFGCGTDDMVNKRLAQDPVLKAQHEHITQTNLQILFQNNAGSALNKTSALDTSTIYYIPIVFHILHEYGSENITDAQVIDAVNILNRDYMKRNPDTAQVVIPFKRLIGRAKIQFRLAGLDPSGNCTNGINHIYTHMTNQADDFSKFGNGWPQNKYLNIWVTGTIGAAGVAGYSNYPSSIGSSPYGLQMDGVIILSQYIGSIGTGNPGYSRALGHEVGHYLGLAHTWGSTNSPGVACGDDGIPDTPLTKGHDNCSAASLNDKTCDITDVGKRFTFDSVKVGSGPVDPAPIVLTADSIVKYGPPTAVGVSTNSSTNKQFAFTDWGTGALDAETTYTNLTGSLDPGKYYETSVTPRLGVYLTAKSVTFNFQRNATGVRTFAVRSSADGFTNNLPISVPSVTPSPFSVEAGNVIFVKRDTTGYLYQAKVTLSGAAFTNTTVPLTFRVYAWNAEDAAGSFRVDSLVVNGTAAKLENTENYMEYSYCSKMFTQDQIELMRFNLTAPVANRSNLITGSNLTLTGTDVMPAPICAPVADFKANRQYVCFGQPITFTSVSWRAPVTSYNWTFSNGTPATSTASNVAVTFSQPGWQQVTLTVSNAAGTDTKTETSYVYVSWPGADVTGPYSEDVETSTSGLWIVENPDADWNQFRVESGPAFSGSKAFHMSCLRPAGNTDIYYDQKLGQSKDGLVSPKFNLNGVSAINFSFKYSCATRGGNAADITEKLTLSVSTDCGATWAAPAKTLTGGTLANAGYSAGYFTPSGPNQWTTVNTPISFAPGTQGNVRFRLQYTASDVSNGIYIDDINISGTVGVDETASNYFNLNVYPNPSENGGDLTVDYFSHGKKVVITIVDMLGREVYTTTEENVAGEYQKNISGSDSKLKAGMYFVNVGDGTSMQTKKVIIH